MALSTETQAARMSAWGHAFLAAHDLQKLIERTSRNLTLQDDWSWQEPYRTLAGSVWTLVNKQPSMAAAHDFELQCRDAIREIEKLKGDKWA